MLREELQKALKESMLNKDTDTVSAVRLIIAGMKEKDVDARGKGLKEASDADLMSMMQSMIKQRNDSIKMYVDGKREDLAAKERKEISIIERFLPKQMSDAEIEAAIKGVIAETGAASMKDMGKVMGALNLSARDGNIRRAVRFTMKKRRRLRLTKPRGFIIVSAAARMATSSNLKWKPTTCRLWMPCTSWRTRPGGGCRS